MARYWVGGTGTWDNSSTTHWSASSGGSSGATAPTSSDNVFFNSNSGLSGGTVSMNPGVCNNFTSTTGASYTIDTGELQVYGNFTSEAGVVWTNTVISFISSDVVSITPNGDTFGTKFVFISDGVWTLQGNLVITGEFYQENGIFNANGFNITANNFYFYSDVGFIPIFIVGSGTMSPAYPTSWTIDRNNGVSPIIDFWIRQTKPTTSNYTNIAKPSGYRILGVGRATGVLGPPTYSVTVVVGRPWIDVPKPASSAWVDVNKPI